MEVKIIICDLNDLKSAEMAAQNKRLAEKLKAYNQLIDAYVQAVTDAAAVSKCTSCAHYLKKCHPLNPKTGCKAWKWRGINEG